MNIDKVVSSLASSGVLGGLAGGALSGAVMSNKKARKAAGTALKVGGIAALGGLAWKSYQAYKTGQENGTGRANGAPAATADPVWNGLDEQSFAIDKHDGAQGSRSLLLIQAMIAAACADGHLDSGERERIMNSVNEAGLASDEKALVFDSLHQPLSITELSNRVDCPELAAEVYMASLIAVDNSRPEAAHYLDALAFRLGVPPALVTQMQQQALEPPRAVA